MEQKVCGVTGHREIPAEYMEQAEQGLRREIEKAIADGYTYFISGFADGADQLFARIVLEKAKENPALRLEAAIPYRNRYKRLMEDGQTRAMLEACAKVAVISEEWASNVYMKRNRYIPPCSGTRARPAGKLLGPVPGAAALSMRGRKASSVKMKAAPLRSGKKTGSFPVKRKPSQKLLPRRS